MAGGGCYGRDQTIRAGRDSDGSIKEITMFDTQDIVLPRASHASLERVYAAR